MLILLMVIVPEPWFKVVVFLVGSPVIVLLVSILKSVLHSVEIWQKVYTFLSFQGYFWSVVNLLHNYLRDLSLKSAVAAIYQNGYKVQKNYANYSV